MVAVCVLNGTHGTLQQFMELFSIKEMPLENLDCIIPA
jgi:hypothetical protein